MTTTFTFFAITWLAGLGLFNAVVFLVPGDFLFFNRFEQPVFWIAYALVTLAFLLQIVTAFLFCNRSKEKMFLALPVLKLGYSAVTVTLVVGSIFLLLPIFASWFGVLVSLIVTAIFIMKVTAASTAAAIVSKTDARIEAQTSFVREALIGLEATRGRAEGGLRSEVQKVYDALRFSDTVSTPALAELEYSIKQHLRLLEDAVLNEDRLRTHDEAGELLLLIEERNSRCMAGKGKN